MSLQDLFAAENNLTTHMGKAFLSERVVLRGLDLHHDLVNQHSWFAVHLYAITGRFFESKQLTLLEYLWSCTSYPDASIWPNNTASLAASVRSTASLAMAAGLVTSEASLFGLRPLKRAFDFFYRANQAQQAGQSLTQIIEDELQANGMIYGYGRPLASLDERIPHTLKQIQDLGFAQGSSVKMALAVNDYLIQHKQKAMNIAALDAAVGVDFGFSAEQFHLYMNLIVYAGQPPCYLDALQRPQGSFCPIRCSSVVYSGRAKREWE
jgi:hypothetical protein